MHEAFSTCIYDLRSLSSEPRALPLLPLLAPLVLSSPASVRADAPQVRSYEPVVSRFLPTGVLNRAAHLGAPLKSVDIKKAVSTMFESTFYIQEGTIRVKVNSTVKALQIYEIIYDVQNR